MINWLSHGYFHKSRDKIYLHHCIMWHSSYLFIADLMNDKMTKCSHFQPFYNSRIHCCYQDNRKERQTYPGILKAGRVVALSQQRDCVRLTHQTLTYFHNLLYKRKLEYHKDYLKGLGKKLFEIFLFFVKWDCSNSIKRFICGRASCIPCAERKYILLVLSCNCLHPPLSSVSHQYHFFRVGG